MAVIKKGWMTIKEVAQLTGRHEMTIRSWIKKGILE